MGKFNTVAASRPAGRGPITTIPSGVTPGTPGQTRDAKSALFLLAVSNMVGETTFHEDAGARDSRFTTLVGQVAVADLDWLTRFARWLRSEANMRSGSLVLAVEAARAALAANIPGGRDIVAAVLQRADEPGEMIAYWHSRYGKTIPKPIKRGIADAARRLYNERAYLKWDSDSDGVRMADVIRIAHVNADGSPVRSDLYQHIIGRRLGIKDRAIPETLPILAANADLRALTPAEIRALAKSGALADRLRAAGMTWEAVPALVNGAWTRELWEAIIPSMGYMALLRNLRNFDQAGVSEEAAAAVAARLSDLEQVKGSRQFPFRFYTAHKAVGSLRWGHALETGLRHSLANIPALPGRTLVLVDQSPSMFPGRYYTDQAGKSDIVLAEKAALFGSALALRAQHADLHGYGFKSYPVSFGRGDSVLLTMGKFRQEGGTDTLGVLQQLYQGHDRVVIVTDEQTTLTEPSHRRYYNLPALRSISSVIPARTNVFVWNLAGYTAGHATGPNWHVFGGLTDRGFEMIPIIESGRNGGWPF